jgi:Glycosyltransferase family 87
MRDDEPDGVPHPAAGRGRVGMFVACLAMIEAWLGAFFVLDWGHGLARGALLLVGAAGLAAAARVPRRAPAPASRALLAAARAAAVVALAVCAVTCAWMVRRGVADGDGPTDQSQDTIRAAAMLRAGENPYGFGAMLDPVAFEGRAALRAAAGIGPVFEAGVVAASLRAYWAGLDRGLRGRLLPVWNGSTPKALGPLGYREAAILGYKYGPVLVTLAAPATALLGPLGLFLLNTVFLGGWLGAIALIVARAGIRADAAVLTFAAVAGDPHVIWNSAFLCSSDIFVLAFVAAAVLAFEARRPAWLGVAVAFALGCKVFPAVLLLPLLVAARSWRAPAAFAIAATVLFGPWLAWDAEGFLLNYAWWPTQMVVDSTSWIAFASARAVAAGRAALVVVAIGAGWRLARLRPGEPPFVWLALAALAVVGAGSVIHNNYIPWFSSWMFLATGRAWFGPVAALTPGASAPARRGPAGS